MRNVDKRNYEVVVGNIGTVYSGRSGKIANEKYESYCATSGAGIGRGAYESVTLFHGEEIEREYLGAADESNAAHNEDDNGYEFEGTLAHNEYCASMFNRR